MKVCYAWSAFFHNSSKSLEMETAENNTTGVLQYLVYAKGQTIIFSREGV